MDRRGFLKVLVASGLVSAANLSALTIPEANEYPDITYRRDWVPEKVTYLHNVHAKSRNGNMWEVCEYSDHKELPQEILNDMMAKLKERL